jgi:ribosome biogenesis GTPase
LDGHEREVSHGLFFFHPFQHVLWRNKTVPSREEKQWQHHAAAKKIRKIRKEIKRNRKPKRVRRKAWNSYTYDDLDALDEIDLPQSERVMPRGERERRRANHKNIVEALQEEEVSSKDTPSGDETPGPQGVVVEVSSSLCQVDVGERSLTCSLRGSLSAQETGYTNVVAVGDAVIVSENGADGGVVEAVLPRRSVLARPDVFYSHLQQVIVANADQLLIVASWLEPHIWPELIDRYLIAAERCNLQPIICLNKIDLADDVEAPQTTLQPYRDLGYRVILTSALTRKGVGKLRKALSKRTTVLAGLSGVGKSSLLSAVQPELQLRIGQINDETGEGRHTTTQVVMHQLERGGYVVDTPGIREFGLSGLRRSDLAHFYPEIADTAIGCRFGDCSHIHEPGCAVRAEVQGGNIPEARYHSYTKIYDELST